MQPQVTSHAAEAASSVATITTLDRVKRNMELACSTLREATELSGLFIKVTGKETTSKRKAGVQGIVSGWMGGVVQTSSWQQSC
jgi:hypothetical protein